jgi:AP2 domain
MAGLVREIEIPIGPSIAYVPLTQGLYALIDREDVPIVEGRNWYASKWKGGSYARISSNHFGGKNLHQLIPVDRPEFPFRDHRNGNGLDNRRANLRGATMAENVRNTGLRKPNKTGFKGIRLASDTGKWRAALKKNGKTYGGGSHIFAEEAARAYDRLASKHHGEFAKLNFPEVCHL